MNKDYQWTKNHCQPCEKIQLILFSSQETLHKIIFLACHDDRLEFYSCEAIVFYNMIILRKTPHLLVM